MIDDESTAPKESKLTELREAIDVAVAELDAGLGVESSVDEFMAEVWIAVDLDP